jgi:hypothetical protein
LTTTSTTVAANSRIEAPQQRAAGMVVADHPEHEHELGVHPAAAATDAVAEPQQQAERERRHHQQAREAVQPARHQQQPLALGVAVGRDHGEIDEQSWQVEQAGEPAGHEHQVAGLQPEVARSHRRIIPGGRTEKKEGPDRDRGRQALSLSSR